ncbi:DUF72 domain-containing protein [candidate division KSB1 bacterium]|nr:DUF72 domain-containing protein [candidate division KSB1 bacterium]
MKNSLVYIGPAGWAYPDWKNIFYPNKLPTRETELSYLSKFFNLVEVNSSFYRIPTAEMTQNWLRQVKSNKNFGFTCKLYQGFTHQPAKLKPTDLENYFQAIEPLHTADKLLAVLLQFPWSFKNTEENYSRLHELIHKFGQFPLALEIRHKSWETSAFLNYLTDKKLTFVNIDQPVIGESIGFTQYATSNQVYFRFHGRNYQNWFRENTQGSARYDYFYSVKEQNDFMEKIGKLISTGKTIILVYNNHFRGQAVANGFQMKFHFEKQKQAIPSTLLQLYPELKSISSEGSIGKNLEMFS